MNIFPNDITQTTSYRVIVAILFGLMGFGLNALDIQLVQSPALKISILAGLFFPLLIALAWGWRYGLLSALAGGCQTMWWLWQTNGWGIIYGVPVFTLWIVWHGWWTDRRDPNFSWRTSPFIVEIPVRIGIELGFFTIFPWLVSFNPPPWNSNYTWNLVPLSWMATVAIKHTITSYILLLAAYVTLSLGPVRRAFGLRNNIAQQDTHLIYAGALVLGLFLWAIEAWFHYQFINTAGRTFWDIAVLNMGAHDAFMRFSYIFLAFFGATALIPLVRRRAHLQQRFDHQNKVLKAIRNVNKLITREKNPDTLLKGTCDALVATRGYEHAWIVLLDSSRNYQGHAQAGMPKESAKLLEQLYRRRQTVRCRGALASSEIVITRDPRSECTDCPLAHSTHTHGCMTLQLGHQDTQYGLITVVLPVYLLNDPQEQSLFREVADDLAYALHGLEVEKKQQDTLKALQKSEQRFSKMVQHISGVAIQGYGPDGRIHFWNQASESLYGYTEKEALGKNLLDLIIPAQMHDEMRNVIKKGVQTGKMPPVS
jgi:PAS domain-containing protein